MSVLLEFGIVLHKWIGIYVYTHQEKERERERENRLRISGDLDRVFSTIIDESMSDYSRLSDRRLHMPFRNHSLYNTSYNI